MNNHFCDIWVIQLCHANDDDWAQNAEVHHLRQVDLQWHVVESIAWKTFLGSAKALASLCLPETRIILPLPRSPERIPDQDNPPELVWGVWQEAPLRLSTAEHFRHHDQLAQEIERMGNTLSVVLANNLEEAPGAPEMTQLRPHEVIAARAQCDHTEPFNTLNRLAFILRLALQPGKRHQQGRLACAMLCLGVSTLTFYAAHNQFETRQNNARLKIQQTLIQKSEHNTPDWESWRTQMRHFGQNHRANITALQWSWSGNQPVMTTVELRKPRKRLPKNCLSNQRMVAVCASGSWTIQRGHP